MSSPRRKLLVLHPTEDWLCTYQSCPDVPAKISRRNVFVDRFCWVYEIFDQCMVETTPPKRNGAYQVHWDS